MKGKSRTIHIDYETFSNIVRMSLSSKYFGFFHTEY